MCRITRGNTTSREPVKQFRRSTTDPSPLTSRLVIKRLNLHVDDTWKTAPKDENYLAKYYRWRVFSFAEAVQNHRESHHPSMYNEPDADLMVHVELNMVAEKQTRTIDDFRNIVMVDHTFNHGSERKIIVLAKGAVSGSYIGASLSLNHDFPLSLRSSTRKRRQPEPPSTEDPNWSRTCRMES